MTKLLETPPQPTEQPLQAARNYQQAQYWTADRKIDDSVLVGKRYQTPQPCSCFLC